MSDKVKLSEIAAVSGIGGLHKIIGRTRGGILIESLNEVRKKQPVPLNNKVSVLSEIAMFSISDDVRLGIVFENIRKQEESGLVVPGKDAKPDELKKFMSQALPDYDQERVLVSHMQKLANWYRGCKDVLDWDDLAQANQEPQENEETSANQDGKFVE